MTDATRRELISQRGHVSSIRKSLAVCDRAEKRQASRYVPLVNVTNGECYLTVLRNTVYYLPRETLELNVVSKIGIELATL